MFNGQEVVVGVAVPAAPDSLMAVEFLTGNPAIDADHQQLHIILKAARSICFDMLGQRNCAACSQERHDHCENLLLKLLGDLLSLILEHFQAEELMMRESLLVMVDHLQCELHMEDHAAISSRIERTIAALDTLPTVDLLREIDKVLGSWVMNHVVTHDMALVNWIEREDSALRSGF
jgi:hemerythrin-like metal-binding protein